MSIRGICVFIIFFAWQCKSDDVVLRELDVSDLPLKEEKIIQLLGDMHYASASAQLNSKLNVDSLSKVYSNQVLEIHKIDSMTYNRLMDMLESDLKLYYDIEQKVHTYLKGTQSEKSVGKKK